MRIELTWLAWKASALPLSYTRIFSILLVLLYRLLYFIIFANESQPVTFGLSVSPFFYGRGGEIRTPDPLVPSQVRYQAALRPVELTMTSITQIYYRVKLFY
jgi:hypothetical protein